MKMFCGMNQSGNLLRRSFAVLAFLVFGVLTAAAQGGNTISGHVFGTDRKPLSDINVELLDDYYRTISRQRTNAAGRYYFAGVSSGRFTVRAMPLGTNYEQQDQEVEIVNILRPSGIGGDQTRITGHSNEQRDFYLRPRFVATGLTAPATVFAQEVPDDAKQLYKTGLQQLENNQTKEGCASIKAAIEAFPKYFLALETLGIEYVKAGYFEAGAILLSVAIEVNPRAYKSWYGLARADEALKKYSDALGAAEKAVELNGSSADAAFLAGKLQRQSKDYARAEKNLTKARDLSGDSLPDVHFELALLYAHGLKHYKDAAKELRQYLKARPDDKNAENIKKLIAEFETKADG